MYIEPNTVIRILKDCPLDNTYDHTIYFASKSAQVSYFTGLTKHTLTQQTYQRVKRGYMRVALTAESLYDCNYLMFQNSAFGSKWFYAFIKSVEYVNNVTAEVEFEIDVMQTWYFDYELGQCFVEREHSATDVIGDNLVPEKLELGEYVSDDFDATGLLGNKSIVVGATFDEDYDNVSGTYYCGLFSGLYFHVFPNTTAGAQDCADFISGAGSKSDGIVSVFLMPTSMVGNMLDSAKTYNISKTKNLTAIGSYTNVKNNKLFTHPYNFLYVTNLQGNYAEFPYEYFSEGACTFALAGDMTCNPQVVLVPTNYKGVPTNYDEKMVLSGFPQLSFNTDSFKAWLAQNASGLAVNGLSTALSTQTAVASAGISAWGATSLTTLASAGLSATVAPIAGGIAVAGMLSQVYQHAIMPRQAHGGTGAQTMAAIGLLDFAFMHKHITPEFARIIDDYFTMYGYATHRVKVPNTAVRPHWTYTKTAGCVVTGSIPCDDMRKICGIYDKGITFWRNGANVGNYSLDNSV